MIKNIAISFRGGHTVLRPKPGYSGFGQVLPCSQSPVTDFRRYMNWRFGNNKPGANDPSCWKYPFKNERYLFLSEEQELWWYGLLVECAQGRISEAQIKKAWENLVMPKKAFTNNKSDDYGMGYILKEAGHLGPLRLEPVICNKATVKLIGNPYEQGGEEWQNIELVDMLTDAWKTMTYKTHWWIIQPANSSVNVGPDNGEDLNPFPKLGNRDVPYFLWGLGTTVGRIEAGWIRKMTTDEPHPGYPYSPLRATGTWSADGIRLL